MKIELIVTEKEAFEQLYEDAQSSLLSTAELLRWLNIKETEWVAEFEQLAKEAKATDMNHYKINKLIGLSVLIPVLNQFRTELESNQKVFTAQLRPTLNNSNDWGDNNNEVDDWLKT